MKFGPVPVNEATGAILAHSRRLSERSIKKGHLLTDQDIKLLQKEGIDEIVVAQLEENDIDENMAAAAVTNTLSGFGVDAGKAFTGRCNLIASHHGLMSFDEDRLNTLNILDERVTVATLPPGEIVVPGQLIATIKIIPFAVPNTILEKALDIASGQAPLVSVIPFKPKKIGLILTRLPGMKESVLDNTYKTAANRVEGLGSFISREIRCDHDRMMVAEAIQELQTDCDLVFIFGASAVVDREDVLPAAVVSAGGEVEHFGMPVDPGNLLFIGSVATTPVVGMPGCARSPKLNGFDWVLWRLLADVAVTARDIMLMGSGGLLKEISERGQLRQGQRNPLAGNGTKAKADAPIIAALLLAAGSSRRMGKENKLLAEIDGEAMISRICREISASKTSRLFVVTGHEQMAIEKALSGGNIEFVHNADHLEGLSSSLRMGLAALPDDLDGVVVCLGDMPMVKAAHINQLIDAFDPLEGRAICLPVNGRKRGNPILWGQQFLAEMSALSGDIGARHMLEGYSDQVCEVNVEEDGILFDIDTPEKLEKFTNRNQK